MPSFDSLTDEQKQAVLRAKRLIKRIQVDQDAHATISRVQNQGLLTEDEISDMFSVSDTPHDAYLSLRAMAEQRESAQRMGLWETAYFTTKHDVTGWLRGFYELQQRGFGQSQAMALDLLPDFLTGGRTGEQHMGEIEDHLKRVRDWTESNLFGAPEDELQREAWKASMSGWGQAVGHLASMIAVTVGTGGLGSGALTSGLLRIGGTKAGQAVTAGATRALGGGATAGSRFAISAVRNGVIPGVGGLIGAQMAPDDAGTLESIEYIMAGAGAGRLLSSALMGRAIGFSPKMLAAAERNSLLGISGQLTGAKAGLARGGRKLFTAAVHQPNLTFGRLTSAGMQGAVFGTMDAAAKGMAPLDAIQQGVFQGLSWMGYDVALSGMLGARRWMAATTAATNTAKLRLSMLNPTANAALQKSMPHIARFSAGAGFGAAISGGDLQTAIMSGFGSTVLFAQNLRTILPASTLKKLQEGGSRLTPAEAGEVTGAVYEDSVRAAADAMDDALIPLLRHATGRAGPGFERGLKTQLAQLTERVATLEAKGVSEAAPEMVQLAAAKNMLEQRLAQARRAEYPVPPVPKKKAPPITSEPPPAGEPARSTFDEVLEELGPQQGGKVTEALREWYHGGSLQRAGKAVEAGIHRVAAAGSGSVKGILPGTVTPQGVSRVPIKIESVQRFMDEHGINFEHAMEEGKRVFRTFNVVNGNRKVISEAPTLKGMLDDLQHKAADNVIQLSRPGMRALQALGGVGGGMAGLAGDAVWQTMMDSDDGARYGAMGSFGLIGMLMASRVGRGALRKEALRTLKLTEPLFQGAVDEKTAYAYWKTGYRRKQTVAGHTAERTGTKIKPRWTKNRKTGKLDPVELSVARFNSMPEYVQNQYRTWRIQVARTQPELDRVMQKYAPHAVTQESYDTTFALFNKQVRKLTADETRRQPKPRAGKAAPAKLTEEQLTNNVLKRWRGYLSVTATPFLARPRAYNLDLRLLADDASSPLSQAVDVPHARDMLLTAQVAASSAPIPLADFARRGNKWQRQQLSKNAKRIQEVAAEIDNTSLNVSKGKVESGAIHAGDWFAPTTRILRFIEKFESQGARGQLDADLLGRGYHSITTAAESSRRGYEIAANEYTDIVRGLNLEQKEVLKRMMQDSVFRERYGKANPEMLTTHGRLRTLLDTFADQLGLEKGQYIEDYFPWYYSSKSVADIRQLLQEQFGVRTGWKDDLLIPHGQGLSASKIFRSIYQRTAATPLTEMMTLDEAMHTYIAGATRKIHLDEMIANLGPSYWNQLGKRQEVLAGQLGRLYLDVMGIPSLSTLRISNMLNKVGVDFTSMADAMGGTSVPSMLLGHLGKRMQEQGVVGGAANALRSWAFFSKLGGSFMSAMTNLTQIVNSSADVGLGNVFVGGSRVVKGKVAETFPKLAWLDPNLKGRNMLRVVRELGIGNMNTQHIMRTLSPTGHIMHGDGPAKVLKSAMMKFAETSILPFSTVERFLRVTTAAAAERSAQQAFAGQAKRGVQFVESVAAGAGAGGFLGAYSEQGEDVEDRFGAALKGLAVGAAAGAVGSKFTKSRTDRARQRLARTERTLSQTPMSDPVTMALREGAPSRQEVIQQYMKDVVSTTQFSLGKESRGMLLRTPVGGAAGALQTFTLHQMEFATNRLSSLLRSAHNPAGGIDVRFLKYGAYVAGLSSIYGMTMGFAGSEKGEAYWLNRIGVSLLPMVFYNNDTGKWSLNKDAVIYTGGPIMSDLVNAATTFWHLTTNPDARDSFAKDIDGLAHDILPGLRQLWDFGEYLGNEMSSNQAEWFGEKLQTITSPLQAIQGDQDERP